MKLLISPELALTKIQYCFCVLAENGVKKMHYNEKHKIFKQQTLDWKQAVVSVSRLPWVYWGCVWTKITWSNTSSLIKPKVTRNKAKERALCQVLNLFCLWVFKIYDGGQSMFTNHSLNQGREKEVIQWSVNPNILAEQPHIANFNAFNGRAPKLSEKVQSVLTSSLAGLARFCQFPLPMRLNPN